MTNRGSAFFLFCGACCGGGVWRICRVAGILLLLIGGELVLPFELQFQRDLIQFLLQTLVLCEQPMTASPLGIKTREQRPPRLFLLIRQQYQRTNPAPPKCGQWLTFGQLCSCLG